MKIQDKLENHLEMYLGEWPEWKIKAYAKAHGIDKTTAIIYLSESFIEKHKDYSLDFLLGQFKTEIAHKSTLKAA